MKRASLSEHATSVPAGAEAMSGKMIWLLWMVLLFSEGLYLYI